MSKQEPILRKHKIELSVHFSRGGNVSNVPDHLKGISLADRQSCFDFWKKRANRPESVPQ